MKESNCVIVENSVEHRAADRPVDVGRVLQAGQEVPLALGRLPEPVDIHIRKVAAQSAERRANPAGRRLRSHDTHFALDVGRHRMRSAITVRLRALIK